MTSVHTYRDTYCTIKRRKSAISSSMYSGRAEKCTGTLSAAGSSGLRGYIIIILWPGNTLLHDRHSATLSYISWLLSTYYASFTKH